MTTACAPQGAKSRELRRAALLGDASGLGPVELAGDAAGAGLRLPGPGPVRIAPAEAAALVERCGVAPRAVESLASELAGHPLALCEPRGLLAVLPSCPRPGRFVLLRLEPDGDGWAALAPEAPTGLRALEAQAFGRLAADGGVWANGSTAAWARGCGFRLPGGSEALLMDERTGRRAEPGAFEPFPTLAEEAARAREAAVRAGKASQR